MLAKSLAVSAIVGASILAVAAVQNVASKPEDAKPIGVGKMVPKVNLTSLEGKSTSLESIINNKTTVLIFYRGGWCPFCMRHLKDLGSITGDLKEMGAQIVAISPDKPEDLKVSIDKNELAYTLFSDSSAEAMKAFGVAFRLDDETFGMYKERFNIDLERSSGQNHHILPVPSVYVVNGKGEIKFAHNDPNYRVRLEADKVLAAAKTASQ
ncbi:MAG: peroxiredoxin-like family protein [Fimbriimonadaceae bacterium]